jgi:hypothetical protein
MEDGQSDVPQLLALRPSSIAREVSMLDIVYCKVIISPVWTIPINLHDSLVAIEEIEIALCAVGRILSARGSKREGLACSDSLSVNRVVVNLGSFIGIFIKTAPVEVEIFDGEWFVSLVDDLNPEG